MAGKTGGPLGDQNIYLEQPFFGYGHPKPLEQGRNLSIAGKPRCWTFMLKGRYRFTQNLVRSN